MLVIDGLTVRYGSLLAVDSVRLRVRRSEILAINGRSGAGKSTLLYAIAGLVSAASGSAMLGGRELLGIDEPTATMHRRRMGFVFQSASLFPELDVLENVTWVGRLRGLDRRSADEDAAGLLSQLGIRQLAGRRPGQLSGGEAQRVNVARALIGEVDALLVDEPTASLDERTSHEVRSIIASVAGSRSLATSVVSHDPIVAAYASRRVTMDSGAIA